MTSATSIWNGILVEAAHNAGATKKYYILP